MPSALAQPLFAYSEHVHQHIKMALNYTFSEARDSDAGAIASLFAESWTSPFVQLQFGPVDTRTLAASLTPPIVQQIANTDMLFIVARESGTEDLASVAQWTIPIEASETAMHESEEDREEHQKFEDELYYNYLSENCNKDLIMEFTIGLRSLRERLLGGRRHFLLENLATHPHHRGKGLASRMIESVLQQADEQNVLVYLETASDNKAMQLYKKLGFQEEGSSTIKDLSHFVGKEELDRVGAENEHTHVAFIRYPGCLR
jgi:ribosomal protein S18 acetylase RimI-like enzyme